MQEKIIKVGDRVAWQDVPDGALVRDEDDDYAIRINGEGAWVSLDSDDWRGWRGRAGSWLCAQRDNDPCTLIALGVTEDTTGNELRAYAEAFDCTCAEAHAKADALRAAVAEIEAEAEKCHAAAAVCPDVSDAVECEARAVGLAWALDVLRKAGAL